MRVYTTGPYLVKPLRRHRTYIHDKPFVPRNDASFFLWKAGSRDKMIMGYLVRGSGIRGNYFAIQGQILYFFP